MITQVNAKFYNFNKSSYKTYVLLSTNCVKLVDNVLVASGGDILRLNGVITPGAYYYHLNNEYKKKKTFGNSESLFQYIINYCIRNISLCYLLFQHFLSILPLYI